MISPERMEELDRAWNDSALWDEEDYLDWFLDLTQEEQDLIAEWDRRYELGVARLAAEILAAEERRKQQQP